MLYQSLPSFLVPEDKRHLLSLATGEKLTPSAWFIALPRIAWRENHWLIVQHKREWQRFLKRYLAALREMEDINLNKLSWKELFDLVDRLETLTDGYLKIHRWSITYADILYQILRLVCQSWLGDKNNQMAPSLITGLEGNITVEINTALWQLSCRSKTKIFKTEFNLFMQRYGHCSNTLDLGCPRWREKPEYIRNLIQQLSQLAMDQSPKNKEVKLRRLRQENTRQALKMLSASSPAFLPSWRAHLFTKLLDLTQYFVNLRENQRFYWQMSLIRLRQVLLVLAQKLRIQKIMARDEDVFLLTKAELSSVFSGELSLTDISHLLHKRRRQQHQNQSQHHPPPLIGPDDNHVKPQRESGRIFKGIGVSPGITNAPATVVPNLKDYQPLSEKSILVTVSFDPGWTPLLGTVAGLVMEVGGYLSHGSIMAREFGIPAVAGVSGATELIKTGKNIRMDGTEGTVEFC
jgi:pyruvate,water dikinase